MPGSRSLLYVSATVSLIGGIAVAVYWSAPDPARSFQQALQALEEGRTKDVIRTAQRLEKTPGFAPHAHVLFSGILLRSGDPAGALNELASSEFKPPLRQHALFISGKCLYRLGRLAEAERVFRELAEQRAGSPDVHRWLGAIYYDLGAMDQALRELEQLTELAPDDFRPHRLMGLIHFDFEHYAEAIEHYRQALAHEPPANVRREVTLHLAEALLKQREYDSALEVLADVPMGARALALRSECHWNLGKRERADRLLEQALNRDPDELAALLLKGRIALNSDHPQQALAPLQRVLANDANHYEARYLLAQSYRSLGQLEKHEAELQRMKRSRDLRQKLSDLNHEAIQRPWDADVREKIADLCDRLDKPKLAASWRRAAESCRTASPVFGSSADN